VGRVGVVMMTKIGYYLLRMKTEKKKKKSLLRKNRATPLVTAPGVTPLRNQ